MDPMKANQGGDDALTEGAEVAAAGTALRNLRALRYDPPGYAKQGARRTTFQSALEQCEQFLAAATEAGYATRSVQLFYALSQAGRAMVAASPRIGNQAWRVSGHGLSAKTDVSLAADVSVTAARSGLFPAVASALGIEALAAGEPAALSDLWPLLPEAAFVPLTNEVARPVLRFFPGGFPYSEVFSQAEVYWIPKQVRDLYGEDHLQVKHYLNSYPSLADCTIRLEQPMKKLRWSEAGPGLRLDVEWRRNMGSPPLMLADNKTTVDLGIAKYRAADDCFITPRVGSMSSGLHPFLALWASLLALSSLARYEPALWSKMIDIDRSAEANAIEHLLEEAITSVPAVVEYLMSTLK
ncbi:YaaC family protein [Micromonospora sp. CA-249363]|uniref:YaaC family protein n=1 Tax=Micromonospora sp. CA-249363 TaxID=3239963 RepID=UPI003D93CFA8